MFIYKLKPQKSKGKGNDFSTGNHKNGPENYGQQGNKTNRNV